MTTNRMKSKLRNLAAAAANITAGIHNALTRRRLYGEHGDLKLLALVVALVIFFNIRGRENLATTRDLVLPVRVQITQAGTTVLDFYTSDKDGRGLNDSGEFFQTNTPDEFFNLTHKLPKTARVTFRGSPHAIRQLATSPAPHIAVDIDKITKSKKTNHMMTVAIAPAGVRGVNNIASLNVVSIDPPAVRLAWDDEESRRVPASRLHTPTTGEPSQGAIPEIEILTEEILLTGSRRMFERMTEAGWVLSTEKIDVSRRAVNYIESVRLDIPADIGITDVSPQYVNVRVKFRTTNDTPSSVDVPGIPVAPDEEHEEEEEEAEEEVDEVDEVVEVDEVDEVVEVDEVDEVDEVVEEYDEDEIYSLPIPE